MEPISTIITATSIIELIYKGSKCVESLQSPIDRAYAKALKKWAPNKGVRSLFAHKQFSTILELGKYIIDENAITGEIKSLLECFEKELKQDNNTYLLIIEIIERENLNISKSILASTNRLDQRIETGVARISSENEITQNLLCDILERVKTGKQITIAPVLYLDIDNYIPRTARSNSSFDFNMHLEKEKLKSKPLNQYVVDGEKRIVLYSDAQLGKSTELKKLAFELYNSELYNPFLFNLSQYNGKVRLDELIKISDRFGGSKIDVLILDGVDEVADDSREFLITEIENIAENNPNLYVVVSCRSNFEGTNTISGFVKLYLNQLNWEDAEAYIKDKCICYDALLKEICEKKYYEVIFSPFYLNESIKYFQEKGELPSNKTILYEEFINKCFYIDNNRKPNKGKAVSLKARLYPYLRCIAFCMLSSQRQELAIDELHLELHITEDIIQQCLNTSLLYNDEQNNIKFIHNSFKEYIVAKDLAQLTFNQVQSVICYSDTIKIKPAMYNTSILLLGVINKSDELFNPLMSWLINDYKELLVRCGFEILEEEQRNQIFKDIFSDYKQKRLWIESEFSNSLIHFANTKESLLFLCEQIKDEDTYSTNMINALKMLKYAKFSLMQTDEFEKAKQLLLFILRKYQDKIEYGGYLCRPFENECFLRAQIVSEFFEIIKETTNCNIINYLCTITCKIDQCDLYAEWIFSKAEYVHNYTDEFGVGHSVSKDYLIRFLKNLKNPRNIIKAISYCEKIKEDSYSWSKDDTCETLLFLNLARYSERSDVIVDEIISNIKSTKQEKITLSYSQGYRSFINARANAGEIFDKYYLIAKLLLQELKIEKDEDKWNEFHESLNVAVVLLNDERLANVLSDDTVDEQLTLSICNQIMSYPAVGGDFVSKINLRFEHLNNQRYDWQKRNQEAFDILFERELFCTKVKEVIAGKVKIEINDRGGLFSKGINNSIINFIWLGKNTKQAYIDASVVEEKLNDDIEYICFLINQLSTLSHLRNDGKININNTQKEKLINSIIFALTNPKKFSHLEGLIKVIVEYSLSIPDQILLTLFPYAHMSVSYARNGGINRKFYSSGIFLDYLGDNISDSRLLDYQIEEWIKSDNHQQDSFWKAITEHIVEYKKCYFYKYFNTLMCKNTEPSYRFNIAVCITKIGREGIKIVNGMFENLSEEYKIHYYECVLFPEDKSFINSSERICICEVIESKYSRYKDEMKDQVLRLLLNLGSNKALDWGLAYVESHEDWACREHFSSLHKYNSNHIEKLKVYFNIATSRKTPQFRVQTMIDSTIYALKGIANESEEMRDLIVDMFRQKANIDGFFYLHKIADETYDKYFENNYGVITLQQSFKLYNNIEVIV